MRAWRQVARRTLALAWDGDLFAHAARAAFWQTLSLPPLFLALLGCVGFLPGWFGPDIVREVESSILGVTGQVFTPEVVAQVIAPTAESILTRGRADVASLGFVMSLWAGSAAVAALVDTIAEAHGQKDVRHPVWQRIFSMLIYVVALLIAVFALPVIVLGPELLPAVLPSAWRYEAGQVLAASYYPVVGLLFVLVLTTLYTLALPRSLPWRRLLPGSLLAMVVFLTSATGLRIYISVLTASGYTYGALAAPIAFLLFTYLLGIAIGIGAHLNRAVQDQWPLPLRERRLPRAGAGGDHRGENPAVEPTAVIEEPT